MKTYMKNVLLKVYTAKNLGDDLFIKILIDRYPNVQFYLEADKDYKNIFSNYNNLQVFGTIKKRSILEKIYNVILRNTLPFLYKKKLELGIVKRYKKYLEIYDTFICLGGSIFMQYKKEPYYFDIEFYKFLQNNYPDKETFFLGGNFGPYNDDNYYKSFYDIFSNATDVCFREEISYKMFKDLSNVRYTSDIVFGLKRKEIQKIHKSVGFSIVGPIKYVREIEEESYINKYIELINYYVDNRYSIRLFGFAEEEGDLAIIKKIYDRIENTSNIEIVNYEGDLDHFLNKYQEMESVYCGRFHAMILSMLFKQNIYPVVYSKKMTNVLNDIGYDGEVIDLFKFNEIDVNFVSNQMLKNKYNIDKEIIEAEYHFEVLDNKLLRC